MQACPSCYTHEETWKMIWTWPMLYWLHCWCLAHDIIPDSITLTLLILNYYFLMWLSHESHRTRLHSMACGWVQVTFTLNGVEFFHCQSSWEEGNSGIKKEDTRSMPWTKAWQNPLLFHCIVEVGCEIEESRKAWEHFFCGAVILSLLLEHMWGGILRDLSGVSEWLWELKRLISRSILIRAQTITQYY